MDQIGKTIDVYIGDNLVKTLRAKSYLKHLEEAFYVLWKYRMSLNPLKCAFGGHIQKIYGIYDKPVRYWDKSWQNIYYSDQWKL